MYEKENYRLNIENEYLCLLLNKNELFEITQIKPQYLSDPRNKKIFEYSKECYEKYKFVSPVRIIEVHKDFDPVYFTDIFLGMINFNNAWKYKLNEAENSIVKFYKEDIIKALNEKLKQGKINYDKFMEDMKKLDDIQLVENSQTLTAMEILNNINTDTVTINFNNYPKLNNMLELVQGDFLIIGATTGAGKSGFMLNLMNDLKDRYQCIYFNMEMSRSTLYRRLISIDANIKIDDVLTPKSDYQEKLKQDTVKKIEASKIVIEHKANDIKQIKSIIAKKKEKDRHTILFIDHLGLTKADSTKSLYEQATEVAKQLRQICLEYDCTIISASQLNRGAYSSEEITLSMLKDSGELENSASKVILLYKKDKNDKQSNMIIDIAKNRDGITGRIEMEYDRCKQVFKEVSRFDS